MIVPTNLIPLLESIREIADLGQARRRQISRNHGARATSREIAGIDETAFGSNDLLEFGQTLLSENYRWISQQIKELRKHR